MPRVFFAVLVLLVLSPSAWAARFTTTLDRHTISVGETATLSLTFEGGTPQSVPSLEAPPKLSLQSAGQSSQFTLINGEMTSSVSYNFLVSASQPGDYVIPAIQATVGNQTLTSSALKLKVTKGGGQTGLAFLKVTAAKDTVFVGESFAVEIQLYLGAREDNLQLPQIEGDGFVFGKIPQQPAQSNAQIGNQIYTVVTFQVSAVAVKTGTLALGPAQCSMILHVPIGGRGRSVFDDFFGGVQRKPVTLTSDPVQITVLPLPTDHQPPSFNGAVGSFTVQTSASPTNVTAGDPITLRLEISGQGNLERLPFPSGTDWPGFKLYPPAAKVETADAVGLTGVKSFERVIIPQDAQVKEIPGISFSYFDPDKKTYRTLETAPIPISVHPGQSPAPVPIGTTSAASDQDTNPPAADIVDVKPYLGTLANLAAPLVLRPWFLALQSLPIIAWFGALMWRRRQDRLKRNPRLRRRLATSELVRTGLRELARAAEANDREAFFAGLFRLLQEQLGERLDMPASAITEAVLDERLRGRASDELIGQLHELFQRCNQARYAPSSSSQQLQEMLPRVEAALSDLKRLPVG